MNIQGEYSGLQIVLTAAEAGGGEGKGDTGVSGRVWVRGSSRISLETPLGWSLAALAALQFSGCRNTLQS